MRVIPYCMIKLLKGDNGKAQMEQKTMHKPFHNFNHFYYKKAIGYLLQKSIPFKFKQQINRMLAFGNLSAFCLFRLS